MRRFALFVALVLCIGGCASSADELFLSESEVDELVENFEGAVEAQQLVSEFAFAASRGELDLSGAVYDPPTAGNNFVGTITFTNGSFPFGIGDLTVTFTVEGDAGLVDPYGPGVDLSDDSQITVNADVVFNGTSPVGTLLTTNANFTMTTSLNGPDSATTMVDGDFDVQHGEYDVNLALSNVQLSLDLVGETVTNVTGIVNGDVNIPNYAFDADFSVEGVGDALDVGIDVLSRTITYTVLLDELL